MAAAQVAKKLKDRRQKQTLEEIFRKVCSVSSLGKKCSQFWFDWKVDRDGSGTISLTEYFGIFEEHGVKMSKSESER